MTVIWGDTPRKYEASMMLPKFPEKPEPPARRPKIRTPVVVYVVDADGLYDPAGSAVIYREEEGYFLTEHDGWLWEEVDSPALNGPSGYARLGEKDPNPVDIGGMFFAPQVFLSEADARSHMRAVLHGRSLFHQQLMDRSTELAESVGTVG